MRVLVTGASGFIGSNLVPLLGASGHAVEGVDSFGLTDNPDDYDSIVCLSALSGVEACSRDAGMAHHANVTQVYSLLEAVRTSDTLPRVVFASSMAVLAGHTGTLRESLPPAPTSIYGATKAAAEAYCTAYRAAYGLGTSILRFANVYGPHSWDKTSLVAAACRQALRGGPVVVNGDGQQQRAFIFVGDLCEAVRCTLERAMPPEGPLHIVGRESATVESVARRIADLAGVQVAYGPERQGDATQPAIDMSGTRAALGDWGPRTSLDDGLRRTWEWFQAEAERREGVRA